MNKTIYPLLAALLCLLLYTPVALAQGPDGFHYTGQPFGNLVVPLSDPGTIYGSSGGNLSYGPRPSIIYDFQPGNSFTPFPRALSDTLEMLVQLEDNGILYGTAIRYNGLTKLKSYVFSFDPSLNDFIILKEAVIAASGTFSVQAIIGNTLYGLRTEGGNHGYGVLFKIDTDGSDYSEIRHFQGVQDRPEQMMVRYQFNDDGTPDLSQPVEFWTVAFAGGSHGKGALISISIDGSSSSTRLDFTGHGGADDSWGPTDGAGPIAIVQDIDTDGYVITQSGGANNHGSIFLIGMDGNWKVHDFTAAYGTPSGIPIVDRASNKIFGIGGNVPGKKGFIYSFSLISDYAFNDHFVDFNTSTQIEAPIALAPGEPGYIVGTSRRGGGADHSNGTIFNVNTTTGSVTREYIFEDGYVKLSGPADNSTDVSINPLLQSAIQAGATQYYFQMSETEDFSGPLVNLVAEPYSRSVQSPRLEYSTTYYVRVKTDISFHGPKTKFTTHQPNKFAFVSNPGNGAIDRPKDNLSVTANLVYGASFYTIQLSTSPSFTPSTTISKTSAFAGQRTLIFDGLTEGATYYSRVTTDIYNIAGPVRTFTVSDDYSYVIDPADNKTDVSINPVIKLKIVIDSYGQIADDYELWISEDADFSDYDVVFINDSSDPITSPPLALKYGTTYYTMVKTNYTPDNDFGRITTFTTHPAEKYSFVSSPVNGATNVAFNNLKVTANQIIGATSYTIELNTSSDFTGTSIVKTSAVPLQRTMTFNGLTPSTTYYNRTRTNLPSDWGPVRSFTTAPVSPPPAEQVDGESLVVRVYPNPFTQSFTAEVQNIRDEKATIVLLDITGRQVFTGEIRNNDSMQLGKELPQGIYILQVKSRNSNSIHRLAKK